MGNRRDGNFRSKQQCVDSVTKQLEAVRKHWSDIKRTCSDRPEVKRFEPFLQKPVHWFAAEDRGQARKTLAHVWNLIIHIEANRKRDAGQASVDHRRTDLIRLGSLIDWADQWWQKLGGNERLRLMGVPIIVDTYKERFPEGMPIGDRYAYFGAAVVHVGLTSGADLQRVYNDAMSATGPARVLTADEQRSQRNDREGNGG